MHPVTRGRPKGKGKQQNSRTLDDFSLLPSQRKRPFCDEINLRECNQINYGKEIVEQQQIKQYNLNINDEDETYDDKNFHSEEYDVFEIPDVDRLVRLLVIFWVSLSAPNGSGWVGFEGYLKIQINQPCNP
ncbi:hypothetical protein C1646_752402 [Rhizophagus diaphanus]|nr:hypothetical protein C1646_752402 [Rhizophagus diaphanus] [Rhizophagus sp. MUCL 43196]